jgi:hypothetical protein
MLRVMRGDDCNSFYLPMVILDKPSMFFKRGNILPTIEPGGTDSGSSTSPHPPREPSRARVDAALPLDELDRLSLIIRVAGYALRFFVDAPSDTPSLDAC